MANVTLKSKLILRNDTEANWQQANPVLLKGEAGLCSDGQYLKFGDGKTKWTELPFFNKSTVVLKDTQPDEDSDVEYDIGTIWINVLSSPTEIFMRVRHDQNGDSWISMLSYGSIEALGLMREGNFARSPGSGAATGYVDKALVADKLSTERTVTIAGGVNGSATFDGSSNIRIAAKLAITPDDLPAVPLAKILNAGTAIRRNAGNGAGELPVLDAAGKLDTAVLPQLAVVDVVEAASDQEMTAKTVQKGDICLRSDEPAGAFILAANDPHDLANWKRIPTPANAVLSVNGKVGVVTLTTDNIAEGASNQYFSASRVTAYLQDEANTFILDGGNA